MFGTIFSYNISITYLFRNSTCNSPQKFTQKKLLLNSIFKSIHNCSFFLFLPSYLYIFIFILFIFQPFAFLPSRTWVPLWAPCFQTCSLFWAYPVGTSQNIALAYGMLWHSMVFVYSSIPHIARKPLLYQTRFSTCRCESLLSVLPLSIRWVIHWQGCRWPCLVLTSTLWCLPTWPAPHMPLRHRRFPGRYTGWLVRVPCQASRWHPSVRQGTGILILAYPQFWR